MEMHRWEKIETNSNLKISRLKVPGGWIYDYDLRSIFVPEPSECDLCKYPTVQVCSVCCDIKPNRQNV
jgi:hypothetical protein